MPKFRSCEIVSYTSVRIWWALVEILDRGRDKGVTLPSAATLMYMII